MIGDGLIGGAGSRELKKSLDGLSTAAEVDVGRCQT